MAVHHGRRNRWLAVGLVDWQGWATVSGIMHAYVCILYLKHKDPILAILCTNLPIIIILVGERLNGLIFHSDIKCVTANEWSIIHEGANYVCMSSDDHLFYAINCWELSNS